MSRRIKNRFRRLAPTRLTDGKSVYQFLAPTGVSGTADEITIVVVPDGTITLSLPPSIKLDGAAASRLLATDAGKKTVSVANLAAWIAGTTDQVTITDDGDGTVTLSLPANVILAASLTVPEVYGGSGAGDDLDLYSTSDATAGIIKLHGPTRTGDPSGADYAAFEATGTIKFNGLARIGWQKITANSVTLDAGTTPAGVVGDLQSLDGTSYHIDEAAATPGQDLKVDFIDVTAFNWVQVVANYSALVTAHSVSIQLYKWGTATWITFHSQLPNQQTPVDHSFFVPDDTDFIGTGGDAGRVRVRFNHTQAGNALHDNDIDVVALYQ